MMRRALVATILLVFAFPPTTWAGGVRAGGAPGLSVHGRFSGRHAAAGGAAFAGAAIAFGAAGATYRGSAWYDDPAILIVDATPAEAQVYLDGRPLGAAGELVALALPMPLGPHVVQVVAPGFRPWVGRFVADGSFPVRIRATLTPQ